MYALPCLSCVFFFVRACVSCGVVVAASPPSEEEESENDSSVASESSEEESSDSGGEGADVTTDGDGVRVPGLPKECPYPGALWMCVCFACVCELLLVPYPLLHRCCCLYLAVFWQAAMGAVTSARESTTTTRCLVARWPPPPPRACRLPLPCRRTNGPSAGRPSTPGPISFAQSLGPSCVHRLLHPRPV